MALSDLTTESVHKAIEEFDQLKRDAFLEKYGFGPARNYMVQANNRSYDSKAIAGAAHGYLPERLPLAPKDFSGGEATVKKKLEDLGFTVANSEPIPLPLPGDVLTNEQIGRHFVVGNMGGMRRSTKLNLLVLISDPFKGLYQDRWEDDVLYYTGMGPTGDQSLTYAQNKTLNESPQTGIPVHLLEALDPMKYTYAGEVALVATPQQEEQVDDEGHVRNVWMFPIKLKPGGAIPVLSDTQARIIEETQAVKAKRLPIEELKSRAKRAKTKPALRMAQTASYVRDAAVAEYAKRLANGHCDLCEKPAPFQNKQKEAYLECHHIVWLAKGGDDTVDNTVALCPNCHRKMHVLDHKADKQKLTQRAAGRSIS